MRLATPLSIAALVGVGFLEPASAPLLLAIVLGTTACGLLLGASPIGGLSPILVTSGERYVVSSFTGTAASAHARAVLAIVSISKPRR